MSLPPGFTCANPPSRVTWQCRECFQCIDADREDDPYDFGWRDGRCPECGAGYVDNANQAEDTKP